MVKAINEIKEKNIILQILGTGNEKDDIKGFIKKYKLQNKIFLLGYKKNLRDYYLESDLFINASYFEGFPNALVEAINFNLPVICSDTTSGVREITLNGKGGDLFKVGDYKNLAKKISLVYQSPKILNKKLMIARKNIKNFSIEKNVEKYEFVFKKI